MEQFEGGKVEYERSMAPQNVGVQIRGKETEEFETQVRVRRSSQ